MSLADSPLAIKIDKDYREATNAYVAMQRLDNHSRNPKVDQSIDKIKAEIGVLIKLLRADIQDAQTNDKMSLAFDDSKAQRAVV